jgi:hypothetical protein
MGFPGLNRNGNFWPKSGVGKPARLQNQTRETPCRRPPSIEGRTSSRSRPDAKYPVGRCPDAARWLAAGGRARPVRPRRRRGLDVYTPDERPAPFDAAGLSTGWVGSQLVGRSGRRAAGGDRRAQGGQGRVPGDRRAPGRLGAGSRRSASPRAARGGFPAIGEPQGVQGRAPGDRRVPGRPGRASGGQDGLSAIGESQGGRRLQAQARKRASAKRAKRAVASARSEAPRRI